jgi:hypothetical protein
MRVLRDGNADGLTLSSDPEITWIDTEVSSPGAISEPKVGVEVPVDIGDGEARAGRLPAVATLAMF